MTATHTPGCPAIADPRHGCSCLLRQTSSTGPVSSYPPPRVLPTSRGPGEEREYGTPHDDPCDCQDCRKAVAAQHDPLCPAASPLAADGWDCQCALIAKARADERGKTIVSYDLMKQRKGYEQGQRDEREACIALVETVAQSGAYIDYVEIDSVIAAIRARSDGGES